MKFQLKANIIANLLGGAWTSLLGLLFVPFYLKFLGIEAYGLIGFNATLQSIFGLLDLGLGLTLNREMARLSAKKDRMQEQRDLLRTLETIYWAVALLAGLLVVCLAGPIANHWMNPNHLSRTTVENVLRLMGLGTVLQFPFSLYQGGLTGLQRQVLVNAIVIPSATVKSVGALLLLWQVSRSVELFFVWQVAIIALQTSITAWALWRTLSRCKTRPVFRPGMLRRVSKFAIAVSANSIIGAALSQTDKMLLSRLLPLVQFGYYTLAGTISAVLWTVIIPINTAVFPKFSQYFESGDEVSLARLYHTTCQLMAAAVLPIAVTVGLYSRDIVLIWTRNPQIADHTHLIVTVLIFGTAVNGIVSVPSYLQSAANWPQLMVYTNLVNAVVLVPLIWIMSVHYGAIGAAAVWCLQNVNYLIFQVPIMHRRLLPEEKWKWYFQDVGLPICGAVTTGWIVRNFRFNHPSSLIMIAQIAGCWLLILIVVAILSPQLRRMFFQMVRSAFWGRPRAEVQ